MTNSTSITIEPGTLSLKIAAHGFETREIAESRSPDAEAGFCAVLSDFVSDCSEGLVPNARSPNIKAEEKSCQQH